MPTRTAIGTASGLPLPAHWANSSSGTQPWMAAPRAMPTSRYGQIFPTTDLTSCHPKAMRSSHGISVDGSITSPRSFVSNTNGSTHRSRRSRPRTYPATIATRSPNTTYRTATFHPNIPRIRITATSFTMGEAMRKLRVIPSGTPAATNPMNAGTAEHEQNGVTTPSPAAATLPRPSLRPPRSARVRSIVTKLRSTVTMKMIPPRRSRIFVVS